MVKRVDKFIHSKKVQDVWNKIINFVIDNKSIIMLCIPFILMDLFTMLFVTSIHYTNYRVYAPLLFNICWIGLFVGVSISFKKWIGKTIYILINLLFITIFMTNNVYFSVMNSVFDFSLVEAAGEGAPYLFDALKTCNPFVYVAFVLIVISLVFSLKNFPDSKENNFPLLGIIFGSFIVLHLIVPLTLGRVNKELTWSSWRNARNIYETFNDSNKGIKVCGFFEYNIRSYYITFLKPEVSITEEDLEFLDNSYAEELNPKNKYTGRFKDKNLIIVQLEGMDSWIINKNDTPTIYKMMNNSINFTKHYSFYNGGGSTFNSEFAINTGYVTPFSYSRNAYTFNKNSFPNSLAHIFKNMDYTVNAFHMNSGEYYSRTVNYNNWGYDNYYGLKEISSYPGRTYELDRNLILDEKFQELMFPEDKKFVDYIITYSGHYPFTNTKDVCKMLYNEDVEKEMNETGALEEPEFVEMFEEECVRRQNQETDYMMKLLLEKLEEKNLINDTVIVVVTDHYLYTIDDRTILDRYKNTSNNLINNTPFFIWTNKGKKTNISQVTSQLNILPTILNLYGIEFNKNNYIGEDALNPKYSGIVFFNDYSWYDGNVYVDGGEVTNDKKISQEKLIEKGEYVSYLIKKNDLTLKYNYFK